MRPALLRLLKRPSAVSILDTLTATPIGIEQLESRYRCLRCHSGSAKQEPLEEPDNRPTRHQLENSCRAKRPFSFPIYDIEASNEPNTFAPTPPVGSRTHNNTTRCPIKLLSLQPDKLEFESDVGHLNNIGTRLVDNPEHRNNLDLWEELLRHRQRHYGDNGTLEIWEGLRVRVDGVRLPVAGEQADFFWQNFVDMGLRREIFLKEVIDYAVILREQQGNGWPQLYERVVGGFLDQGLTKRAVEWHKKLQSSHLASANDVLKILPSAIRSSSLPAGTEFATSADLQRSSLSLGLQAFQAICSTTPDHNFYGPVIAMLVQQGHGEAAISMHRFLARRQDHPQSPDEIQPLLEYVEKFGLRKEFNQLRGYVKKRFDTEALIDQPGPIDTAPKSEEKGSQDGKPFKDDIGAKLFATRALNFDMIVGGLKMLGVSEIGHRTLRELATRAHGNQDLLDKLKILKQSGISTGSTVFSRLIQKLASQNRDILLSDFLRSDQHPDILEDKRMQESMLVSYYMARDWRLYNMTLAVLTELYSGAPDLYDIHFRKHIAAWELNAASKVADELALRGRTLGEDSVDFLAEQILTPRRMNHRPPPGQRLSAVDEVMFIFKILKRVVPAGGYVSAAFWVEMLKRLGMAEAWADWDKLRDCCQWLVRQYAESRHQKPGLNFPPAKPSLDPAKQANGRDRRMLDLVFTPQMQAAIVSWGFMFRVLDTTASKFTVAPPNPQTDERLIPWVRGLILLRELEQSGLRLDKRLISQAVRHRLAMLYSHHVLSARRMNRMLRRRNPYSLQQVLNDVFQAWGDPSLFDGMEQNLEQLVNPPRASRTKRRAPGIRLSLKGL
ncbi:hypothetical protein N7489_010871 [Penicillium chrysogenum]|jgi:hypothetical protein|uniref:Pentatricopeptide repeat-containing protein n=1 Tax=Penicillium chrysogenum TaxID=5076 RepID=A0ABQ8WBM7_PENCH|nr:uncharacterized protein N7489_010871 [Penicillium chrysogenum]KAJ5230163.1 hypothetical protein N7489_010871 [Penicillium chrysogenum]KAJ5264007.1 hypothetical protein N7505_007928 [Penicillium chrysogenum]KAJ5271837.1 hypothetical protein N7524_005106 [Penicillium chrysogenum]KAJ6163609.1 hypothetical protein N7497_003588 [Penicillium chrysogenum]